MNTIEEKRMRVQQAATFNTEFTIPQLCQLLGYRQRLAQEILETQNTLKYKDLLELYEHTNNTIKKLIGI